MTIGRGVSAFFCSLQLTLSGVISGVGKGIIASSTGLLLKTMGLKMSLPVVGRRAPAADRRLTCRPSRSIHISTWTRER